jgi:hypothetical protein
VEDELDSDGWRRCRGRRAQHYRQAEKRRHIINDRRQCEPCRELANRTMGRPVEGSRSVAVPITRTSWAIAATARGRGATRPW